MWIVILGVAEVPMVLGWAPVSTVRPGGAGGRDGGGCVRRGAGLGAGPRVDALRAIGSPDHVLAERHPRVVVDDTRRDLLDRLPSAAGGVRLWSHTGRPARGARRRRRDG